VTFSRRDFVAGYVQGVADGIIRNVSVGYVRHRVEMATKTSFKKGDLVTWKDGLRDRLHPEPGWPAIVLDIFIDPIIDPVQDTQSPTFRREFDLLCGVVVGGVMYTYFFESRRMRKFEGSAEGL
jgi:hypothetical protein